MRPAIILTIGVLGLVAVPAISEAQEVPAHVVDGRVDDWRAASPLVAGATAIAEGELVHQDHIFDDTGASGNRAARQHSSTPRATSAGHFRYPQDLERYADNAADLFQVRLAVDGGRAVALAWLDALRQPDTTVVSLAFDVDGGAERRPWPHEAGVSAAGVDVVVTAWGAGGTLVDLRTGTKTALADVAVSTADNAIEVAFPVATLAGAGPISMWATSGLWDAAAGTYRAVPLTPPTATHPGNGGLLPAASRVWNVAFRASESGAYQDERQAAALAAGDVTPFSYSFELAGLRAGVDRAWTPTPGTFYVALLDTGFTIPPLGEGVSYDGIPGRFARLGTEVLNQEFSFLGRYQPYGLYLPSTWDGRARLPAALVLHGHGSSHSSYNQFPGFLDDVGEHPPTVLVTPLARGSSFYADYGEREVLEVLEDIERRWSIDPERLYLTGYSMGGYGVYRLGSLYPDRFAGAVAWAGYTGEFLGLPHGDGGGITSGERDTTPTGDPVRNLESFLHLPVLHLTGTNDEIVPLSGQLAASRRLDELGYRHRLDLYPGYEHLSFGIVDEWSEARAWLGEGRREVAPREIALAVSEGWRSSELQPVLELPGASAWWITSAAQRDGRDDPLAKGVVRATSEALPGTDHTVMSSADLVTLPTPHVRTGVAWQPGAPVPVGNRLALELRNIDRVEVDLARAGLTADGLVAVVETDGRSSVSLTGVSEAVTVTRSPDGASSVIEPHRVSLHTPGPGRWVFSIEVPPRAMPTASPRRLDPALPATGGGGPPPVAAGLLLIAVATLGFAPERRP